MPPLKGEYPRNEGGILTARDFNVVYLSIGGPPIGYIQEVAFTQTRKVSPRYELGLDEISYLSPGAVESNTLEIKKFLYVGGEGGYGQYPVKLTYSILDNATPIDIAICHYPEAFPMLNPVPFFVFRECWFQTYHMEISTGDGQFSPLVDSATLMFTWMEGRPGYM